MTRGRKRLAWRIAASLAAEVVLTVGVAWALAPIWLPPPSEAGSRGVPPSGSWGIDVPSHWPRDTYMAVENRWVGRTQRVCIGEAPNGEGFGVILLDTGWPCRAMRTAKLQEIDRPPFQFTFKHRLTVPDWLVRPSLRRDHPYDAGIVPTLPVWPGFALNTIFYASIVFLFWSTPGFVRRRRRLCRGHCPACGYDLRASAGKPCPECGS